MFQCATDGCYYNSNLIISYYLVCVKGNKTHWSLRAILVNNEEITIADYDNKLEAEQELEKLIGDVNNSSNLRKEIL